MVGNSTSVRVVFLNMQITFVMAKGVDDIPGFALIGTDHLLFPKRHPDVCGMGVEGYSFSKPKIMNMFVLLSFLTSEQICHQTVERDQSGYRRYSQQDLDWIGLLMDLRAIGMPRAQMARLGHLLRQGFATTLTQRRLLLEEYQHTLQLQVQEMEQHIQGLQDTIDQLKELEAMLSVASPQASAGTSSATADEERSAEDPEQDKTGNEE
jgi:DNA-binding transcriptional MerR regulator